MWQNRQLVERWMRWQQVAESLVWQTQVVGAPGSQWSVGIASQTLMLAAKAMGYDSCPMIGFDPVKVAEIIQLPENHVIGMLLTIGKAIKEANPRGGQLAYDDVVIRDSF